jgi:hypothetical protein
MTNVRDFGAVGDGRADDTEAIEHAVAEGAGSLVLPRGRYRLTRGVEVPLDARGPIAISGSGGTACLVMEAPGPALRFTGTHQKTAFTEDFDPRVWTTERMPRVEALAIEGAHDEADGLVFTGTMQATVSGVLIRRCRHGIRMQGRNRNLLVADSHLYHGRPGGIGLYLHEADLHQAIVVGCHISYWPHAGIKVERSEIRNLQITGCDIEYNHDPDAPDSADVWIDARGGRVREGTIASNTIQAKLSPGGSNVRIEGPDDEQSRGAGLWTITGNVLQSQAVNLRLTSCRGVVATGNSFASGYERSILARRCRLLNLAANTLDYNPDYEGDRVDGITLADCRGVNLNGLSLQSTRGAAPAGEGGALTIERSADVLVGGCQVLDAEDAAIRLVEVERVTITGCMIVDRPELEAPRPGIVQVGACRDVVIVGNSVSPMRGLVEQPRARAGSKETHLVT